MQQLTPPEVARPRPLLITSESRSIPSLPLIRREDDLGPGEGAPGATGEKAIELEATQPGTFTVRFERRRDWEPGADREQTLVVDVGDTSQPLRGGREGAM